MKKKKTNNKAKTLLYALVSIAIIAPYIGLWLVDKWHKEKVKQIENARFILISKEEMKLYLYDFKGGKVGDYQIACGKNPGNKETVGDMKTPEGVFAISEIQDASTWSHDFKDGAGVIEGAYGPYFIRLSTPGHKGIGIHGTHKPESIGTRDTEGCIRLQNESLQQLVKEVHPGMVVVVTSSYKDIIATELGKKLIQESKSPTMVKKAQK